ncbi:nicotinate-nucleotide diphosphorylase (carboxylating) [Bryobacterales bacterium F-183]|nr:nicotinate-nucleotide diphosphorylase (carboxylating) [Bryobacterales bacterium F-183]
MQPNDSRSPFAAIVAQALAEDIGSGDVTTQNTVPAALNAEGTFFAKQDLVLAGSQLLPLIFTDLKMCHADGDFVRKGDALATVRGTAQYLLTHERVSLNFLQQLSGIATLTRRYVEQTQGTKCQILDTRKTTPGLRMLEKLATKAGGALNHRMGLYDAILIKNNHIDLAGGVTIAVELAKKSGLPVECEVRNHDELAEALDAGVKRILLDNMTPAEAAAEIEFIDGRASVEISGGVTLETVRAYAQTGADFISVGALTHSAPAADINFRIRPVA